MLLIGNIKGFHFVLVQLNIILYICGMEDRTMELTCFAAYMEGQYDSIRRLYSLSDLEVVIELLRTFDPDDLDSFLHINGKYKDANTNKAIQALILRVIKDKTRDDKLDGVNYRRQVVEDFANWMNENINFDGIKQNEIDSYLDTK